MEELCRAQRRVFQKAERGIAVTGSLSPSEAAGAAASLHPRTGLLPRAEGALELLDAPDLDIAELRENLVDLEIINRTLGGAKPLVRAILKRPVATVLDVGAGGADIPRALVRAARKLGKSIHVTCVDQNEHMVELARERCARYPEISFVHADGTALPFAGGSFDATMSAATLHHCEPDAAVAFLRELRRVAKVTPIVGDLRRAPPAYAGAHLIGFISRNRLTKNDAPLSVRRAYTPQEAYELARLAGWNAPNVRPTAWYRLLMFDAR